MPIRGDDTCPVRCLPAVTAEAAVVDQLRAVFRSPDLIARTYRNAVAKATVDPAMQDALPSENQVRQALMAMDPVWDVLFPKEQERIVKLLVERVLVHPDTLEVIIRSDGLESLVDELRETTSVAESRKVPL